MYPFIFPNTIFKIKAWDLSLLVGFIVVLVLSIVNKPKDFPITRVGIGICTFLIFCFGMLGARIISMFLRSERSNFYLQMGFSYGKIIALSSNAFLGALLFEILTVLGFVKLRLKRISFLVCADYAIPFMMLHQVFVRVGCFLNGCCYGRPTKLPWGMVFSYMDSKNLTRHPTQLYYLIFVLFNFFIMRHIYKKGVPAGTVFFASLALYGILRCTVEFLRVDSVPILGPVTLAQAAMLLVAFTGFLGLVFVKFSERRGME
ncbi:MAG: prolipoprotein diacylglyceryl transferase [Candidatus Omnitrophica bacterium]|nr:prolipoprotein diacylglyceryl transferase [Candidatus Omnitrophota bacterium]